MSVLVRGGSIFGCLNWRPYLVVLDVCFGVVVSIFGCLVFVWFSCYAETPLVLVFLCYMIWHLSRTVFGKRYCWGISNKVVYSKIISENDYLILPWIGALHESRWTADVTIQVQISLKENRMSSTFLHKGIFMTALFY